jgi:hypothetical protein
MSATIAEALDALKKADPEELNNELAILEEEISEHRRDIGRIRRTIRQVRQLAGIKATRAERASMAALPEQAATGKTPLWRTIKDHIEHSGPTTVAAIAATLQKAPSQIGHELRKRAGVVFRHAGAHSWALVSPETETEN